MDTIDIISEIIKHFEPCELLYIRLTNKLFYKTCMKNVVINPTDNYLIYAFAYGDIFTILDNKESLNVNVIRAGFPLACSNGHREIINLFWDHPDINLPTYIGAISSIPDKFKSLLMKYAYRFLKYDDLYEMMNLSTYLGYMKRIAARSRIAATIFRDRLFSKRAYICQPRRGRRCRCCDSDDDDCDTVMIQIDNMAATLGLK